MFQLTRVPDLTYRLRRTRLAARGPTSGNRVSEIFRFWPPSDTTSEEKFITNPTELSSTGYSSSFKMRNKRTFNEFWNSSESIVCGKLWNEPTLVSRKKKYFNSSFEACYYYINKTFFLPIMNLTFIIQT